MVCGGGRTASGLGSRCSCSWCPPFARLLCATCGEHRCSLSPGAPPGGGVGGAPARTDPDRRARHRQECPRERTRVPAPGPAAPDVPARRHGHGARGDVPGPGGAVVAGPARRPDGGLRRGPGRRPRRGPARPRSRRLRRPSRPPARARPRADAAPGLAAGPVDDRVRRVHRALRGRPARGGRAPALPRRARRALPAPHAPAAPARRATATAGMPWPTTGPCAPTSGRWTTSSTSRPGCTTPG